MADPSPTLPQNDAEFKRAAIALFDRPAFDVAVTAGAEAANVRAITLQVIDRAKHDAGGYFVLLVWLAATSGGSPSAAGNTVAFTAGTVQETILANAAWRVLTNSAGLASFNLTIAGVASRYVESCVVGRIKESSVIAWT